MKSLPNAGIETHPASHVVSFQRCRPLGPVQLIASSATSNSQKAGMTWMTAPQKGGENNKRHEPTIPIKPMYTCKGLFIANIGIDIL